MDCLQNLMSVDEDDLLDELPERSINKNDMSFIDINKDDSGLGISESMEILKENVENQLLEEFGSETSNLITDSECKMLPELIPLPDQAKQTQNSFSDCSQSDKILPTLTSIDELNEKLPELQPISEKISQTRTNSLSDDNSSIVIENGSRRSSASSFIDSLLNKLGRKSESSGSENSQKKMISKEPKSSDEDLLVEINSSIAYTKSSNPNMLPTPVVENQSISSVFVNSTKEYEEAIERNKRKSHSSHFDRSKMTAKSQPPRMKPPKLPSNIQNPRTLAQKRLLLANNLKFHMIEQESKIYRQIQRKMSGREVNYQFIEDLTEDEIPIKHGPWKALSWLRTEDGNYIQQYINIDGQNYKLNGSRGNNHNKFLTSQSCKPYPKNQKTSLRSVRCCEGGKVKKRILENLVNVDSIKRFVFEGNLSPYKRLEAKSLNNQLSSIKPRPLSKKIEYMNKNRKLTENDEDSVFLGDYKKYKLPSIKLEVKPQKKIPLDPRAKQYLNEIIPYRDMNENWIKFSLSTLTTKEEKDDSNETFKFTVPYQSGKQHILVREILKQSEETDLIQKADNLVNNLVIDEMKWTFDENCDKNDHLEMEIIDIIKDLTNSVFINLNDDLFTKDDPIERTSTFISPIKAKEAIEEIASTSKNMKIDQSKKMLSELRRLNANVVKSDSNRVDDEEDIRRHALAHLAKDERDLRPTVIVTESDTLLLSNKKTETRRQKRAPKRYSDYMRPEEINDSGKEILEPPKKVKPKEVTDEPSKAKTQCIDTGISHEEMKTLKEEIKKWIHVNLELTKLECLENIQPFCMIHNLYKCSCKFINPQEMTNELINVHEEKESSVNINSEKIIVENEKDDKNDAPESPIKDIPDDSEAEMQVEEIAPVENENSRRVLPIELDKRRKSICEVMGEHDLEEENKENAPKMEILNISELVNGGIGPIYINIYDTKINRLNPIFRSILNNNSALVYLDGLGYYLDMKRIDVMKLKFDNIRNDIEHPVFIIRPKIIVSDEQPKICGDFVNILFKEDSELLLQIKDKIFLKEIAKIIEIILQSVRKKIEIQIGCEPNDLVKEQLSLITRDRSNSNTSVSSADTSPLHFDGKQLECAPAPGFDTDMMKEFNRIFSMRMQRLCAIINSNSLGLHLLDAYVNKFYIYKWHLLLKSFEEDLINIWQVRMEGESGKCYFIYLITNTSEHPNVEKVGSQNITNIKNLALSNASTLIRMILLKMENFNTRFMTVILFGCKGYFRICGLLNSKENYFNGISAKPTKHTHPRLTAKIQKVYNIWHGLKKSKLDKNRSMVKPNNMMDSKEEIQEHDKPVNQIESKSKLDENREIEPKITAKQPSTYKWFLFNVSNDFTDIYIKQWKNYLPYKAIMNAIIKAKNTQRTIRILGPLNSAKDTPRIFALSRAPLKFRKEENENMTENFLLFGPYLRESNSNLLLMQNVDGKMVLRDDYEQKNNIKRTSRTRCLWIYANSLRCITDSDLECIQPDWLTKSANDCSSQENILNSNTPKKKLKLRYSDE